MAGRVVGKYEAGERATCPHCRTVVRFEPVNALIDNTTTYTAFSNPLTTSTVDPVRIRVAQCPACGRPVMTVQRVERQAGHISSAPIGAEQVVWPRLGSKPPAPKEVPPHIAQDYEEANLVLELSTKASAALSRRCLQMVLREQGYTQHDLSKQIDAAIPKLPSHIAGNVDAIRNLGNFAAHPMKDTNSGAILDVEPEEAEWNLEVLSQLFDFYYVQPAVAQQKRDVLNAKLQQAGKPPMK